MKRTIWLFVRSCQTLLDTFIWHLRLALSLLDRFSDSHPLIYIFSVWIKRFAFPLLSFIILASSLYINTINCIIILTYSPFQACCFGSIFVIFSLFSFLPLHVRTAALGLYAWAFQTLLAFQINMNRMRQYLAIFPCHLASTASALFPQQRMQYTFLLHSRECSTMFCTTCSFFGICRSCYHFYLIDAFVSFVFFNYNRLSELCSFSYWCWVIISMSITMLSNLPPFSIVIVFI